MEFIFDIRKAIAAAGVICDLGGGKIEIREMLKMLYLAEKEAILHWHRGITGDKIFSMPQGMVLSRIYDLVRYGVSGSDMDAWKAVFTPRSGHEIQFRSGIPDLGPLSDREEAALGRAFSKIRELKATHGERYIEILHQMLPEWKNPNGSSVLVNPSEILALHDEDPESIQAISAELASLNSARLALQA